jgi:hypothetical protein
MVDANTSAAPPLRVIGNAGRSVGRGLGLTPRDADAGTTSSLPALQVCAAAADSLRDLGDAGLSIGRNLSHNLGVELDEEGNDGDGEATNIVQGLSAISHCVLTGGEQMPPTEAQLEMQFAAFAGSDATMDYEEFTAFIQSQKIKQSEGARIWRVSLLVFGSREVFRYASQEHSHNL